ncbi:aminodeoxychorismate/anthranilate synthase component II [Aliikangiella sp. G2MR2-5]|uniref:anthranilate synthase component II n=1 Tax=Aliikangiella sp. G2MR2-5 TaxID=2788943 RepID=UPI001FEEC844|nr:aminodeoxychorismate/anthranilate synthase component II [Aliikangiella sp. G2MR2-5]
MPESRILMLDNYDSFTFNLVHYLEQLDVEVVVKRNDQTSIDEITDIAPTHIVISPGPCDPDKAGLSLQVIREFKQKLPILGVCLGHQAIGQVFGACVGKASNVVHGKTSSIFHNGMGIFSKLPSPFSATRYHSLVIQAESLPDCLEVTAWTETEAGDLEYIMGIQHKQLPVFGVQFHPESILSEHGMLLLSSFLAQKSVNNS